MAGTDTGAGSLRQRQKEEARNAIHLAALDLFEEQGVAATTVQQVADRVGISPRTFFRYYKSKEQAVLLAEELLEERVDELELTACTGAADALERIETMMRAFTAKDSDPDMAKHRRIVRLMKHQPEFRALVLAQEMDLADHLRRRVQEQVPDVGPSEAAVVAQLGLLAWRVGWDRWGEQELTGGGSRPLEHFDEARAVLRRVLEQNEAAGA